MAINLLRARLALGLSREDCALAMMNRPEGATAIQLAEATGWTINNCHAWINRKARKYPQYRVDTVQQSRHKVYHLMDPASAPLSETYPD